MNWGKAIVLVFVLFAGFIGTMVFWMSRERIDLVRDDYYQDEMAYQRQIDRTTRTARLRDAPQLRVDPQGQRLEVRLPAGWERGTLRFYRPSDRRQDRTVSLKPNQPGVSTADLAPGLWRIKLSWRLGDEEFYHEQAFTKR